MSNGSAERRCLGLIGINVNELLVLSYIGEIADALLIEQHPWRWL